MCFRLLAGVRPPMADSIARLTQLAVAEGLDIRVAHSADADWVEIAWGDCACSLYTGRAGRERLIAFVQALLARNLRVQLLLFQDGQPFDWNSSVATLISLESFQRDGLQSLPEGRVAELTQG